MKIFVGYDTREDIAYQVCEYSALKHSNHVQVILNKNKLRPRQVVLERNR